MAKIIKEANLKKYNNFGLSSKCSFFMESRSAGDFIQGVEFSQKNNIPLYIIGGGTNVVLSEYINGLIVFNNYQKIEITGDNEVLIGSGTPLKKAITFFKENDLGGAEFLSGVPGTVGGAVFGNAGAFGKSISDIIKKVTFFDPKTNNWNTLKRENLNLSYRTSLFKEKNNGIILDVVFSLDKSKKEIIKKKTHRILEKRKGKHPRGKTCGSFFKNIEYEKLTPKQKKILSEWENHGKVAAGKLIEEAGFRGIDFGSVSVSGKHANFLINRGNASPSEIRDVAEKIKKSVKLKFKVELEEEVRYF